MLPHNAVYRIFTEFPACTRAYILSFDEDAIPGERDLNGASFEIETRLTKNQLQAIRGIDRIEVISMIPR